MPCLLAAPAALPRPIRGLVVFALALAFLNSTPARAKTPGSTICHKTICHRVLTLDETARKVGNRETVIASFYGAPGTDRYNPSLTTSSGETYQPARADNVASPVFPDGTRLLVWNPATGHAASVRVNNAGPYRSARMLDASEHLARRLGFWHAGIARLEVVVLSAPAPEEATFRRYRQYAPVPGYLGRFKSMRLAMLADDAALLALMRVPEAPAPVVPAAAPVRLAERTLKPPPRAAARAKRAPAVPARSPALNEPEATCPRSCVFDTSPHCS